MATGTIILPIPPQGFDATNPPGLRWEDGVPELLFDGGSTNEPALWRFRMPENYASGLTAKLQWKMASATTGNVEFIVEVMAITPADAADADTPSYATSNVTGAIAVPGTAGHVKETSLALSNDDGLAPGDLVWLKVARNAADTTDDTAAGDLELAAISLEYTTT